MKTIRSFFCFICVLLIKSALNAQSSEIGFGIGTFNYTGDLVRTYDFSFSQPAGMVCYRTNLSNVVSFRASFTAGKLSASDKNPFDALGAQRNASFNIFLFEAAGCVEYHFLNWRDDKYLVRFSPYLFGGVGLFGLSGIQNKPAEYSNMQLALPFGGGLKYIYNPKWYIALEFGIRKTFFDYLDNVSGDGTNQKSYQYGNPFDNDNYYFFGISLTKTFYDIPCPKNPY